MPAAPSEIRHATCVAIDGHALLIEGPSGAGKSDLALRLIDRGAMLVSDDYTVVMRQDGVLLARAPETIAGKIEVRGIGIVAMPAVADMPVDLVVRLENEVPRMPEDRLQWILGVAVRAVVLDPRPASAPLKVEWALRHKEIA